MKSRGKLQRGRPRTSDKGLSLEVGVGLCPGEDPQEVSGASFFVVEIGSWTLLFLQAENSNKAILYRRKYFLKLDEIGSFFQFSFMFISHYFLNYI